MTVGDFPGLNILPREMSAAPWSADMEWLGG